MLVGWHCIRICWRMTRITFVQWEVIPMAMRKPAGIIQIAFGMPSRLATDDPPGPDEDNLGREHQDDDQEQDFDSLDAIYYALRERDQHAVHVAMGLGHIFQKMANAAARDNDEALDHWWRKGRELMDNQAPPKKGDDNG
jgi:hypothetical protein